MKIVTTQKKFIRRSKSVIPVAFEVQIVDTWDFSSAYTHSYNY